MTNYLENIEDENYSDEEEINDWVCAVQVLLLELSEVKLKKHLTLEINRLINYSKTMTEDQWIH